MTTLRVDDFPRAVGGLNSLAKYFVGIADVQSRMWNFKRRFVGFF
jgi:hypothetical protein